MVVRGGMVLGRRTLERGTAVAIDANVIYQFGAGNAGLDFLNFRDSQALFIEVDAKNRPVGTPVNETELLRAEV